MNDALITAAQNLGHIDGKAHGGWVKLPGPNTATLVKQGYINNSPGTMAICPDPFKGSKGDFSKADDPQLSTVERIAQLADISDFTLDNPTDIGAALHECQGMLEEYEIAFREAFWRTVLDAADTILGVGV